MVLIDVKADAKSSSLVNLVTPEKKSTLSFSELLKGVNESAKLIQNGSMVLALDGEEKAEQKLVQGTKKADTLLSLLQNNDMDIQEPLELNPDLTKNLTANELKSLIKGAKNHLKEMIVQTDGYKQSQIKELPHTLKGLATVAKKFGIDITKITFEEIGQKSDLKNVDYKSTVEVDEVIKTKSNKTSVKNAKAKLDELDIDLLEQKNSKASNNDFKSEKKINATSQANLKQMPIFKSQATLETISTEQVVFAKQFKSENVKTPKDKSDETLKLLLRGEKASISSASLTADFSVATAKVLAPKAPSETSKTLESLLQGDSERENLQTQKPEQITAHKSDSFEVKLNEAKQMIKYLSNDVKTAIEDYKSPFTRIKVQLNPQRLGEIDLTVVQRGKNLHVNLTSNNAAVNALAMNLNDLKVQLSNNGINNATFNFNSSSESGNQSFGQGQNHQNEQNKAGNEYRYFDLEEQNEEILSSLEIVVPSYA